MFRGEILTKVSDWPLVDVHPMTKNVRVVQGDLLKVDPEISIVHQCNCTSKGVRGAAKALFDKWPVCNTYYGEFRRARQYGHSESIFFREGGEDRAVWNMYTQRNPNKPASRFEEVERQGLFMKNLDRISHITYGAHDRAAIAMPYLIGCALAGGDWSWYYNAIAAVAQDWPEVTYYLVKLPDQEIIEVETT